MGIGARPGDQTLSQSLSYQVFSIWKTTVLRQIRKSPLIACEGVKPHAAMSEKLSSRLEELELSDGLEVVVIVRPRKALEAVSSEEELDSGSEELSFGKAVESGSESSEESSSEGDGGSGSDEFIFPFSSWFDPSNEV